MFKRIRIRLIGIKTILETGIYLENSRRNNFGKDFRNRNNDTDLDELTKRLEKMKIQMANLTKNNGRNNYEGS